MFVIYTHTNAKDGSVLATHNKLMYDIQWKTDAFMQFGPSPYSQDDIFLVHVTIPHYEINGIIVNGDLEFNMDLNRLEINKLYKIPFEEKIHSFILREDGMLEYFIHE